MNDRDTAFTGCDHFRVGVIYCGRAHDNARFTDMLRFMTLMEIEAVGDQTLGNG